MTETMTSTTVAEAVVDYSRENGGGTFAAADASRPVSGYAVSVAVMDLLPGKGIFTVEVEPYLHFVTEGNYLGTWYDEAHDRWEISETAVFENVGDAMRLAKVLGERYVYDLTANECIATS